MTDEQVKLIETIEQAATPGPWEGEYGGVDIGFRFTGSVFAPGTDHDVDEPLLHVNGRGHVNNVSYPDNEALNKQTVANTMFCAHARTWVPELLAEVERLQASLEHIQTLTHTLLDYDDCNTAEIDAVATSALEGKGEALPRQRTDAEVWESYINRLQARLDADAEGKGE